MENNLTIPLYDVFEVISSYKQILDYTYNLNINIAFYVNQYHNYLLFVENSVYDEIYKRQIIQNTGFHEIWDKLIQQNFSIETPKFTFNDIKDILKYIDEEDIEVLSKVIKN